MKYAGIVYDDFVNGENVCVSLWTQGCHFHCKGCFNSSTWDFNGGYEPPKNFESNILKAISKNGIQRNFSVLGGEPLCPENRAFVCNLVKKVRQTYPTIKIFIWTGYELEELQKEGDETICEILKNIDVLITGRFILEQRDITLPLRGSRNQKILYKGEDF